MIGALIVSHGNLANELLSAAQRIETNLGVVEAVPLEWTDTVDQAREKIRLALQRLGTDSVIIFTDMFGGTPTNIAASFLGRAPVEVVTGVNLPMVIKLATQEADETLPELARRVRDQGQQQIHLASDILTPKKK